MLKLTDIEKEKLKALAYDETATEALKKLFLNNVVGLSGATVQLTGERLLLWVIENIFKQLEQMKEKLPESSDKKNIV